MTFRIWILCFAGLWGLMAVPQASAQGVPSDCRNLVVDLKKGTLNGHPPTISAEEAKAAFRCILTVDHPPKERRHFNYGGGAYAPGPGNDFYFYTAADFIDVRGGFIGKVVPDIRNARESALRELGGVQVKINDLDMDIVRTDYGCLLYRAASRNIEIFSSSCENALRVKHMENWRESTFENRGVQQAIKTLVWPDWHSRDMDQRRQACDMKAKLVQTDFSISREQLLPSPQEYYECARIGASAMLASAARLECEKANRILKNPDVGSDYFDASHAAAMCLALAKHGARNIDYMDRAGLPPDAKSQFSSYLQELIHVAGELSTRGDERLNPADSRLSDNLTRMKGMLEETRGSCRKAVIDYFRDLLRDSREAFFPKANGFVGAEFCLEASVDMYEMLLP